MEAAYLRKLQLLPGNAAMLSTTQTQLEKPNKAWFLVEERRHLAKEKRLVRTVGLFIFPSG